jgi:hypothetical protein
MGSFTSEGVYTYTRLHMAEDASAGVQELGRKCKTRTECNSATNF